jgi:hypothetical protein
MELYLGVEMELEKAALLDHMSVDSMVHNLDSKTANPLVAKSVTEKAAPKVEH